MLLPLTSFKNCWTVKVASPSAARTDYFSLFLLISFLLDFIFFLSFFHCPVKVVDCWNPANSTSGAFRWLQNVVDGRERNDSEKTISMGRFITQGVALCARKGHTSGIRSVCGNLNIMGLVICSRRTQCHHHRWRWAIQPPQRVAEKWQVRWWVTFTLSQQLRKKIVIMMQVGICISIYPPRGDYYTRGRERKKEPRVNNYSADLSISLSLVCCCICKEKAAGFFFLSLLSAGSLSIYIFAPISKAHAFQIIGLFTHDSGGEPWSRSLKKYIEGKKMFNGRHIFLFYSLVRNYSGERNRGLLLLCFPTTKRRFRECVCVPGVKQGNYCII